MYWVPKEIWEGQDVYIIGGGPSLKTFDWNLLLDKNTIGCNSAFILGAEICKICAFGDFKWWKHYKEDLKSYKGMVVTNSPRIARLPDKEILGVRRKGRGLSNDIYFLAWNGNTGAMAVNLALLLGARRVFLLGFDMKLSEKGRANWHDKRYERVKADVYKRFMQGFRYAADDLPIKFPGREVINLTEDSLLDVFPKQSVLEHFQKERA